jgi:hypothetical protein
LVQCGRRSSKPMAPKNPDTFMRIYRDRYKCVSVYIYTHTYHLYIYIYILHIHIHSHISLLNHAQYVYTNDIYYMCACDI